MRHLHASDVPAILRLGRPVEQFLGRCPEHPEYVRHVELRPSDGAIEIWVHDVEDVGSEEWLDLYGFPYRELDGPSEPFAIFPDVQDAVAFADTCLLADADHWTRQFMAQREYLDYIRSGRPLRWPPLA